MTRKSLEGTYGNKLNNSCFLLNGNTVWSRFFLVWHFLGCFLFVGVNGLRVSLSESPLFVSWCWGALVENRSGGSCTNTENSRFSCFEHLQKTVFFKPRVLIAPTFTVWIFLFESDEKHDFSNSAKSKQPIKVGANLFQNSVRILLSKQEKSKTPFSKNSELVQDPLGLFMSWCWGALVKNRSGCAGNWGNGGCWWDREKQYINSYTSTPTQTHTSIHHTRSLTNTFTLLLSLSPFSLLLPLPPSQAGFDPDREAQNINSHTSNTNTHRHTPSYITHTRSHKHLHTTPVSVPLLFASSSSPLSGWVRSWPRFCPGLGLILTILHGFGSMRACEESNCIPKVSDFGWQDKSFGWTWRAELKSLQKPCQNNQKRIFSDEKQLMTPLDQSQWNRRQINDTLVHFLHAAQNTINFMCAKLWIQRQVIKITETPGHHWTFVRCLLHNTSRVLNNPLIREWLRRCGAVCALCVCVCAHCVCVGVRIVCVWVCALCVCVQVRVQMLCETCVSARVSVCVSIGECVWWKSVLSLCALFNWLNTWLHLPRFH